MTETAVITWMLHHQTDVVIAALNPTMPPDSITQRQREKAEKGVRLSMQRRRTLHELVMEVTSNYESGRAHAAMRVWQLRKGWDRCWDRFKESGQVGDVHRITATVMKRFREGQSLRVVQKWRGFASDMRCRRYMYL